MLLYFGYTMKVLPGLRVLKHAFRGLSYGASAVIAGLAGVPPGLAARSRTIALARDGFWDVHRSLDLDQLADDPQTLALVDLDLCLQRAGSLLLQPGPSAAKLDEAHRLLDLVLRLQPSHAAVRSITGAPSPTRTPASSTRRRRNWNTSSIRRTTVPAIRSGTTSCLAAWQLALLLHDGTAPPRRSAAARTARPAHGGHRRRRAPPGRPSRRSRPFGV